MTVTGVASLEGHAVLDADHLRVPEFFDCGRIRVLRDPAGGGVRVGQRPQGLAAQLLHALKLTTVLVSLREENLADLLTFGGQFAELRVPVTMRHQATTHESSARRTGLYQISRLSEPEGALHRFSQLQLLQFIHASSIP